MIVPNMDNARLSYNASSILSQMFGFDRGFSRRSLLLVLRKFLGGASYNGKYQ